MFSTSQRQLQLSSSNLRRIAAELTLALNLERLKPSYNKLITVACLRSLVELYRVNFLITDPTLFWEFMAPGQYAEVRLAAAACILEYVRSSKDADTLIRLLKSMKIKSRDDWGRRARQSISADQEGREIDLPAIKWQIARWLCERPLFVRAESMSNSLCKKEIFDQFIDLLTRGGLLFDLKLVSALVDAVVIMFGPDQPIFYTPMEIHEEQQPAPAAISISSSLGDQPMEYRSVTDQLLERRSADQTSSAFDHQPIDRRQSGSGLPDVIPAYVQRFGTSSGSTSGQMMNIFSARATADDEEMMWDSTQALDSMEGGSGQI